MCLTLKMNTAENYFRRIIMFEKEAKEYAEDFEKEYHTAYGACLDSFRDGAEFGYNYTNWETRV